jgi:hypothetical protein
MSNYLSSVQKQFEYYKQLGDKSFAQLSDQDINWQYNDRSNSISLIVRHIAGNMVSRFTNFLTEDGEKEWRNREQEFEGSYADKSEMIVAWETGWNCLFNALDSLSKTDLQTIVYIRNEGHTIIEALNRQMMHYAYHIGQIVYLSKMIIGEQWRSLSIPKGQSQAFNAIKFGKEKGSRHFTEDL